MMAMKRFCFYALIFFVLCGFSFSVVYFIYQSSCGKLNEQDSVEQRWSHFGDVGLLQKLFAACGDASEQYSLAQHYEDGRGIEKNQVKSREWLERSAEGGYPAAQYELGYMLYYGVGMEKNQARAIDLLHSAAAASSRHSSAQYMAGCIFYFGRGIAKNQALGLDLLERAVASGNRQAQTTLGEIYYYGLGMKKNEVKAHQLFQSAVDGGSRDAKLRYLLGLSFYFGRGIEEDKEKGVKYLSFAADSSSQMYFLAKGSALAQDFLDQFARKSDRAKRPFADMDLLQPAAARGDAAAQYSLGKIIYYGLGMEENQAEGIDLMQRAALSGYLPAQSYLGMLLFEDLDMKKQALGIECLELAAARGDARSQYQLACILYPEKRNYNRFYEGLCIAKNRASSLEWMGRAAASGELYGKEYMEHFISRRRSCDLLNSASYNASTQKYCLSAAARGNAEAQYVLGVLFYDGLSMKKDKVEGLDLLERAATSGYAAAQDKLGEIYYYGQGIEKNEAKALEWMERALVSGVEYTQYELALLLDKGLPKNRAKTLEWLERLAARGYAAAQTQLGKIYCEGRFVEKNTAAGLKYLERAVSSGYAPAQFYLDYPPAQVCVEGAE